MLSTAADPANQHPDEPLRVIVVSAGTSDQAVIDSLATVSKKLAQYKNLHVAVVGISPEHRATFARAFTRIQERTWFAGTTQEIDALFRSYQGE